MGDGPNDKDMRQQLRDAHQIAQRFTAPKAKPAGRALSSAGSQTSETPSSAGSSFEDSGMLLLSAFL